MRLSVDPSLSWGDIVMTATLVIAGLVAFSEVSKSVALNTSSIEVVEIDMVALTEVSRERMKQERADRERMREEMRQDLKAISDKLDRLIESRLMLDAAYKEDM
ncbi:MAG: hypothetical protein CL494_05315 [Actinobacteria bacterium]|nr:hypothetical protein [Actinomycetota bacterium]|tara:strand:- start:1689 stop:2000 length:312 start_codon:yes stop_codon:yes gene_type:complete